MKKTGTETIETRRLVLRKYRIDDAEDMYRNWASDPEVTRFLTWPTHTSVEVSRNVLSGWTARYEGGDYFNWAIEWKENGKVIGNIAVVRLDEETESAEIGYCLGRAYWGRGIMPEALRAVIGYLFDTAGLNRIAAYHDVKNPRSGKVMEKAGMKFEGIQREAAKNSRGIHDRAWYAILKSDGRPGERNGFTTACAAGPKPGMETDMNEKVQVCVDASKWTGRLEHTWNYIGYDECNYTHSPGGIELIGKFGRLEKPYYMRAHHMLCTGIRHGFYKWGSTNIYLEDKNGNPVYDYETIDRMIDIWLGNHCRPFFELGFMPRDLADPREAEDGKEYRFSYGSVTEYQLRGWCQPPKDYGKWYDLIYGLAVHLRERYGEKEVSGWYFEMWNEPDIFYWHGSAEEYCKLYDYTEAAIHAAMPSARFGGPATTGSSDPDGQASRFLRTFLDHIRNGVNYYSGKQGTRIDFTSFHTKGGGYRFDALAEKQLPSVKVFLDNVKVQSDIIKEFGYDSLECVLSEADPDGWAAGGRFDNFNLNFRNTEYYASYAASAYKNLYDLAAEQKMDLRPLAWAFMFEGERCFEGTRSFSTQGIDKAVLNLFRLFARLGTQRILLTSSRDQDPRSYRDVNGTAEGPEIDGWATCDGEEALQVLLYCHHDDWDRKETFDIDLTFENLPVTGSVRVFHYRIDASHSNAYAEWERQGKPDWPNEGQRAAIIARSGLEFAEAPETVLVHQGRLEKHFSLPTHGISFLELRKA